MSEDYIGEDDLVYNTSARLPVCLCIDTSASMDHVIGGNFKDTGKTEYKDGKMWNLVEGNCITYASEMVRGINMFYDAVRKDDRARLSCELAVVSFDDSVRVLEEFETVERKSEFKHPNTGNLTNMAAGVSKALDMLESRKDKYRNVGLDYYQPWLVLFTDGDPTDDVGRVQERCRQLEKDGKLVVFAFAISKNVNMDILSGFGRRKPISLKDDKFGEFFEWLGKSVAVVSNSRIDEKIHLDVSDIEDWGDI